MVTFAAPDEVPELDPEVVALADPDELPVAEVPVAVPLLEPVGALLGGVDDVVEDPEPVPHAGVGVAEPALGELGDAPPADGVLVLLVVLELLELEPAAAVELEGAAGVQLPVTGTPTEPGVVAATGWPPEAARGFRVWC